MLEILVVVLFLLVLFAARATVLVVWSMKQGHFDCLRPAFVGIRFPPAVLGIYDHDRHGREDRLSYYPKILSANSTFRHLAVYYVLSELPTQGDPRGATERENADRTACTRIRERSSER